MMRVLGMRRKQLIDVVGFMIDTLVPRRDWEVRFICGRVRHSRPLVDGMPQA